MTGRETPSSPDKNTGRESERDWTPRAAPDPEADPRVRAYEHSLLLWAGVLGVAVGLVVSLLYFQPDIRDFQLAGRDLWRKLQHGLDAGDVKGAVAAPVKPAPQPRASNPEADIQTPSPSSSPMPSAPRRTGSSQANTTAPKPGTSSGPRVINLPPFKANPGVDARELETSPPVQSAPRVMTLQPFDDEK
jgi:hypothetical protein